MARYRNNLPQLSDEIFLTDGGMETTFIFHEGLDLPCFAAFDLMKNDSGIETIRQYYRTYAALALKHKVGFILESVTWRANPDWGAQLGYSPAELATVNRRAIDLLRDLRDELETPTTKMVISGCVGPRGDGYTPDKLMSADEARQYHAPQIETFRDSDADMVSAITINYIEEAIGITRAAVQAGMPAVISFTVETDGRLPTGQTLQSAIERVDEATHSAPVYYMINCAHPSHFTDALAGGASWVKRIRGLRANASKLSHAELDACTELDSGNPEELGALYRELRSEMPDLNILGGCCGTDHRHVAQIAQSCIPTSV